jgi:polycomb protein EED
MDWAWAYMITECYSIAFLGDYILSRACYEETIVLWRIEGFNSADAPPPPLDAPTAYNPKKITRSAFANATPASCPAEYTRLLEFSTPECGQQFFMRFSVFQAPGKHPVLAFSNAKSKAMFWDFARLAAYDDFMRTLKDPERDRSVKPERPAWLPPKAPKKADNATKALGPSENDSPAVSAVATPLPDAAGPALEFGPDVVANWESMYSASEQPLKPHKMVDLKKDLHREGVFVGRQVAWSPDGVWCIISGNGNRALLFQRWAKDKA